MPQEPWKRAAQLQRAVPRDARKAPAPPPPRTRNTAAVAIPLLVLILLGVAGWYFYPQLTALARRIVARPASTDPKDAAPAPLPADTGKPQRAPNDTSISVADLDDGLGIGLAIGGEYGTLLKATKGWGFEWQLTATGGSTLRMSAPGVLVYARDKTIVGWRMDVPRVYEGETWAKWKPTLQAAGINPELSEDDAKAQAIGTGRSFYLYSDETLHTPQGWLSPVYELRFGSGRLRELRAGVKLGSDTMLAPESVDKRIPPKQQGG